MAAPRPSTRPSRRPSIRVAARRAVVELRLAVHRASVLAFTGAAAVLGVDALGALLVLWPMHPGLFGAVLLVCGVGSLVLPALRALLPVRSGLTYRPPRRGPHRLPR